MVEIKISVNSDEFRFKRSSKFSLRCEEKRQLFEICKLIALSYELSIDSVTFDFTKLYLSQDRISSNSYCTWKFRHFTKLYLRHGKWISPKMLSMKIPTRFSSFVNQTFYNNLMPNKPENCSVWNASL